MISAINTANQRSPTDPAYAIYLDDGEYIFNTTTLQLPISLRPVKVFGTGVEQTIIRVPAARPLVFRSISALYNLSIHNGNNAMGANYGGSIRVEGGELSIFDSLIRNSSAQLGGGGIQVLGGTVLNLARVKFLSNNAGGGAAIQVERTSAIYNQTEVNAICVEFHDNGGGYGRALLAGNSGDVTVNLQYAAFYTSFVPQDVYNLRSTSTVNIDQSWWQGGTPQVSSNIQVTGTLTENPTDQVGSGLKPECVAQQQIQPYNRVAFTSDRSGNSDIWTMNPDGSDPQQLTTNTTIQYYPTWSPDHMKIAFLSEAGGNSDIYVYDFILSTETRLTSDPASDYQPAWSPDSNALVFVSTRVGNPELYFVLADGTSERRLTTNSAADSDPSWRPFSEEIVFVSDREGIPLLYTLNATSGTAQPLLPNWSAPAYSPVWSPDGSKLVFVSTANNQYDTWKLWLYDPATQQVQQLTGGLESDYEASWSPDSQYIAYVSEQNNISNKTDVFVVSVNGGTPAQVGTTTGNDINPTWSEDGCDLLFVTDALGSGNPEIYRLANLRSGNDCGGSINSSIVWTNVTNNTSPDYEVAGVQTVAEELQYNLELQLFGVVLDEQGRRWSSPERQAILAGVQRVAHAFNVVRSTPVSSLYESFRRVMNPSSTITFVRHMSTPAGHCLATINSVTCGGNIARPQNSVQPYVNVALTEFTVVHELGHILDGRSGNTLRNEVATTTTDNNAFILSNAGRLLMGNALTSNGVSNWIRGERGWGSGPGSVYTPSHSIDGVPAQQVLTTFQRNPEPYVDQTTANFEVAADMFMNWAYSELSSGAFGFQDKDWRPESSNSPNNCHVIPQSQFESAGCSDSEQPGMARFAWIDQRISTIFGNNPSW